MQKENDMRIEHISENKVFVQKKSMLSGKVNSMMIPTSQDKIEYWLQSGELIQNVMPDLDAEQREFIKTGISPEEWSVFDSVCSDAMSGDEDEE